MPIRGDGMADSAGTGTAANLVFTGVQPVKKGTNKDGKWFVIADSGTFSINWDITADIWLVGGGCAGGTGEWKAAQYTALGAAGGDGGYVKKYSGVSIKRDVDNIAVVAPADDTDGTSLSVGGELFSCCDAGYFAAVGGGGSSLTGNANDKDYTINYQPGDGTSGITTPYGTVGSSGGGGMACDGHVHRTRNGKGGSGAGNGGAHQEKGSNAVNYGCGGGGGDGCGAAKMGNVGGVGMQGCIIIQYKIDENYTDPVDNPTPPDVEPPEPPVEFVPTPEEEKKFVIIRNYRRIITKHDTETNNAALSSSSCCCCTTDNAECGCDNSSSNNSYSGENLGTVSNANHMSTDKDELALKIQNLEAENLDLLRQIKELEDKLNIT